MTLGKRAGLTAGTLTLVTATMLGMATPALAAASSSVWVDTDGTRAGEALFNRSNGTHSNKAWFDINDKKCDASSVTLKYRFNTPGVDRWEDAKADGGCGTSAGVNLQTGYFSITYYVCVKTGSFTNKCSEQRTDHN